MIHHPQGYGLGNVGQTASRTGTPLKAGESNYTELGVELGVLGALLWIAWGLAVLAGLVAQARSEDGGRVRGDPRARRADRRDRRSVDRVLRLGVRRCVADASARASCAGAHRGRSVFMSDDVSHFSVGRRSRSPSSAFVLVLTQRTARSGSRCRSGAHAGRAEPRRHAGDDRNDDLRAGVDAYRPPSDRLHERAEAPADARLR